MQAVNEQKPTDGRIAQETIQQSPTFTPTILNLRNNSRQALTVKSQQRLQAILQKGSSGWIWLGLDLLDQLLQALPQLPGIRRACGLIGTWKALRELRRSSPYGWG